MLKKIFKGTFWLLISNTVGRFSIFAINIVVARTLDQNTYGVFATVRSTTSMIDGVIGAALGATGTKNIAQTLRSEPKKIPLVLTSLFFVSIFLAIVMSLILVLITPWLVSSFYLNNSQLEKAFYIGALGLLFSALSSLIQNSLIGFEKYRQMAFTSIMTVTITFPLSLYLIGNYKLNGALFSVVIYFTIDFIVKYLYLQMKTKVITFEYKFNSVFYEAKKLLFFSSPIIMSIIISSIAFWFARTLLINHYQNFNEIAIFDASYQWMSIIMVITSSTTSVLLPMMSSYQPHHQGKSAELTLKYGIIVNLGVSALIAYIFSFFSEEIMSIYGNTYAKGKNVLIILSLSSVVFSTALVLNRYMLAKNKPEYLFQASLVSSPVFFFIFYRLGLTTTALAWGFFSYYSTSVIFYSIKYYRLNRKYFD